MTQTGPTIAVDYYPEHWPEERWPRDFELMRDAGVGAIRIAEFAWCRIEPRGGEYDFGWLDRAIAGAAEYGIRTILCTPTATPPAWLCTAHPEIVSVLSDGRRMAFGARRHYDPSSSVYRDYSARITRAMAEHFRDTASVFAWQIDNELFGNTPCYTDSMRRAFQEWLRGEYGSVSALNEAWGTVFWSQEYDSFEQIPIPAGDPGLEGGELAHHPSLQFAFRRFRSHVWKAYCAEQAKILREINPEWIITTNAYLFRWGDGIDYASMFEELDVYSFDNYSVSLEEGAFYNDLAASITPRYWTLEQRAAAPAGQYLWPPDTPGMLTMVTQTIDHGADLVSFFRYRQCRFGREQDHGAVIGHDGEPRDHYELLKQTSEHARHADAIPPASRPPDHTSSGHGAGTQTPAAPDHSRFVAAAPILIHYSWHDSWARQIARWNDYIEYLQTVLHPGLAEGAASVGDRPSPAESVGAAGVRTASAAAPPRIRFAFADRIARLAAACVPDAGPHLFVIPMAIVTYAGLVDYARGLAEAGATVICTPDLARKDVHNVYQEANLPTEWEELLGIRIERQARILPDAPEVATVRGYRCDHRADDVTPTTASVLDRFAGGPFPGAAAVTEQATGPGRFVYAAGLFERSFWREWAGAARGAPGQST
jgi:beta-galactosidase GanA